MWLPTATILLLVAVSGNLAFQWSWPWSTTTSTEPSWDDLRVTFSILGWLKGFYQLPRTVAEARKQGFTNPPEETKTNIEILCPDKDPSVCLIYDLQGNIAGIELAVQKSDVEGMEYPYEKYAIYESKTRYGYNLYIVTLFFVPQNVVLSGGRVSLAENGTGTGLWVKNGTTMIEIPRLETGMKNTSFTKENCVNGMGRHYYYNISESLSCEEFFPIFALYKGGHLIGFGFQLFGKVTQIGEKAYYESIPTAAIKPTIPNAPQCFTDRSIKYGIVSLHVYFVGKPWDIICTSSD